MSYELRHSLLSRCYASPRAAAILLLIALLAACGAGSEQDREEGAKHERSSSVLERFEFTRTQMGVPFRFVIFAEGRGQAQAASAAAFARVSQLNEIFTDYDSESEAMRLCAHAGDGEFHEVSVELRTLLAVARDSWQSSDGAFDVTCGPLVRVWRRARQEREMPSPATIAAAQASTGMQHVTMTPVQRSVRLEKEGMRLDFGGLAKGFALDEALRVLAGHGVTRALAEAGGDVAVSRSPPGSEGWKIGLAPLEIGAEPKEFLLLEHLAVATSGDTHQFAEIDGVRYSHIVDPRTGLALTTRGSVSVVADSAARADASATAALVLGLDRGMEWIESRPGVAARFTIAKEGATQIRTSRLWARHEAGLAGSSGPAGDTR